MQANLHNYLGHLLESPNASNHFSSLDILAEEPHPYAGYARALLCYYYKDCRYDEYGFQGTIDPRNERQQNNKSVKYYPNPVLNTITIENNKEISLQIIDLNGRVVTLKNIPPGESLLNISDLKNGIFFFRTIDQEGNIQVERIVKL